MSPARYGPTDTTCQFLEYRPLSSTTAPNKSQTRERVWARIDSRLAVHTRWFSLRLTVPAGPGLRLTGLENPLGSLQSALEHRKARHAALRRMAELQESEETFELRRLEYERETWEVERGLQV